MPLTDTAIRSAKPRDRAYKLTDERGLHLHVTAQGSKLWRWAYRFDGKQKLMALGKYPDISLAQAREARDGARKLLASGTDPMAQRKSDKVARRLASENSFAAVARTWWESWKSARSASHVEYVWRRLEADVIPAIGARPIADIEAPELVAMMKAIERRGALDIAKRALQTTSQIFRYAIAHGMAMRNPAADIRPSDVLATRKKENYARIDAKELPALLRKVEMYQGAPTTRAAIRLMAMTFVRTSELIGARWEEFDLDAARWDIPAERMKMKTPHIVPLSTQAVSLLRSLHTLTGHSALLFPGERDHEKPMSNNTILGALDRMGYKGRMTGHGFRGIASTLLHEQGWPHEHIELQLAHQERNRVSASYNHALYLQPRATMMQAWSDYLDSKMYDNVAPLARKRA
ncbi:tyrosine-type recombinase/integrase [Hydrogenophaga intermedia]|uniref:tyrosine-type recombinase/integrase n=1 Tax=Hydrogenophaga intermedia TaxID=65786 RepID=UPI002042E692|nr:integrase arm-type DNA-binding domain-containing protein [Hydrogenophaga intermedia]MCM3566304.1 tyrosine-type recombinase/integrase [Hydrogenophaga intermedia]